MTEINRYGQIKNWLPLKYLDGSTKLYGSKNVIELMK